MKQLTIDELEFLCLGSAVLGSGGGGDPSYALLMAKHQFEQYGPVNIISLEELKGEDLVVPLGIMGAPLINKERLLSGKELETLLKTIECNLGNKPTVLMAGEIGGANAFAPLLIAAKMGLPVLDADLIGRAFPELQMNSCHLQNHKATPAILADCLGNSVIIQTPVLKTLEKLARAITISMGSSAAIALHLMKGSQVPGAVVSGTLSQAIDLGRIIWQAQEKKTDPIDKLTRVPGIHFLARGTLMDIHQEVKEGFLSGSVALLTDTQKIQLFFQNEFLLAIDQDGPIASTPDILVLIEEDSGTPITSEALRYGLQVALIAIDAPAIWQTSAGLELVGPRVFGYEMEYRPVLIQSSQKKFENRQKFNFERGLSEAKI
jgi:DUF917 family protein